eukprot:8793900-Alexandrium_andersonii.AAC.1
MFLQEGHAMLRNSIGVPAQGGDVDAVNTAVRDAAKIGPNKWSVRDNGGATTKDRLASASVSSQRLARLPSAMRL